MRIVQLTEAEAANSAVMENVSRYLLTGEPAFIEDSPLDKSYVQQIGRAVRGDSSPNDKIVAAHAAGKLDVLTDVSKLTAGIGVDAPDVGTERPEVPVASPFAHLGFGTAAPSLATAPEGSAPSLPPGVTQERRAFVPPVPAAPEHQVNAPVAQTLSHAGLDLDKNGLFWDERIHSSSKDKNADNTWRKKRGVEKTLGAEGVAKVEAEIRAVLAIPGPATAAAPVAPPVPSVAGVPQVPTVPSVPAPPPVAAEPEPSGQAFMRWMEDLTPDMQPGGRFTPELMSKLLVAQGLPTEAGLMAFVQRPDLVPAARAMLDVWMADPSQVPQ